MTPIANKARAELDQQADKVLDGEDFSRFIRSKLYACPFCALMNQLPGGLDCLDKQDKRFYLAHMKRDHGLVP